MSGTACGGTCTTVGFVLISEEEERKERRCPGDVQALLEAWCRWQGCRDSYKPPQPSDEVKALLGLFHHLCGVFCLCEVSSMMVTLRNFKLLTH